jgi:hypothetical protein
MAWFLIEGQEYNPGSSVLVSMLLNNIKLAKYFIKMTKYNIHLN